MSGSPRPASYPGEDGAAVVLEMAAGTCAPVVAAAGEASCRETISLIAAVRDRFIADLQMAAALAEEREAGGGEG